MEVKDMLRQMNSVEFGCILDYVFAHRKDGDINTRNMAKWLKRIGCNPMELPGKIVELDYDEPGFRLGTYACPYCVIKWKPGDKKKFKIVSPGWTYMGDIISPIGVYPEGQDS